MDNPKKNGSNFKRTECTDLVVIICHDGFEEFQRSHSKGKHECSIVYARPSSL